MHDPSYKFLLSFCSLVDLYTIAIDKYRNNKKVFHEYKRFPPLENKSDITALKQICDQQPLKKFWLGYYYDKNYKQRLQEKKELDKFRNYINDRVWNLKPDSIIDFYPVYQWIKDEFNGESTRICFIPTEEFTHLNEPIRKHVQKENYITK